MGLSKKRKQHLSHITARSLESRKHQKVDRENQRKKEILRKQREEEDFWDEYESSGPESSSDESSCDQSSDESSLDEPSSNGKNPVEENRKRYEGTTRGTLGENLEDKNDGRQLVPGKQNVKLAWKKGAGDYLRGVRGCGSSATDKRRKRHERDLAKDASETRSIVDMFTAQAKRNDSRGTTDPVHDSLLTPSLSENTSCVRGGVKKETKIELQTRAAHDLGELLRLKTQQLNKYGHVLAPKSSYYSRHQMVRSFLWMQLSRKHQLNRQDLARLVAQSFNKGAYTGRKIVQWERSWVEHRLIPNATTGRNKGNLSWMDDEDLVLSIKEWVKITGDSVYP